MWAARPHGPYAKMKSVVSKADWMFRFFFFSAAKFDETVWCYVTTYKPGRLGHQPQTYEIPSTIHMCPKLLCLSPRGSLLPVGPRLRPPGARPPPAPTPISINLASRSILVWKVEAFLWTSMSNVRSAHADISIVTMMSCKRRKVSPASGAPVVLPEEMVIEVLQWLPVESVLRPGPRLSSDQFRGFHTAKNKIKPLPPKLFFVSQTVGFGSTSVHASSPLSRSVPGDSLAPVCKTNEEIALSSPFAKVIKEALLRLPGDFAVQFKLVSRQWHRFIESGSFARGYDIHNNRDRRPKIRLVGKGTGGSSGFSFASIEKLLQESPSKDTWLDAKVVCSKPCHGMNLISTELEDYQYNPCTGYRYVRGTRGALVYIPNRIPSDRFRHDHAFTTGNKNVGLGFDPLMQEHVIVELFYQWRNFRTCRYNITCSLFTCKSRHTHDFLQPPLPVSDMPPAYLAGFLYWMSEPRLRQSKTRAILSFEIATKTFDVIQCPSCVPTTRHNRSPCESFVVELEGMLCVVLANPFEEELDIWKREHGQWDRAYRVCLKGWPGYSLGANVVVPMAVDPKDGRILLNTGRKLGLYDPTKRVIENLYDLDEVLRVKQTNETLHVEDKEKSWQIQVHEGSQLKCQYSVRKFRIWLSPLGHDRFSYDEPAPALSRKNSACSNDTEIMPLVPILYEDSLASHPLDIKPRDRGTNECWGKICFTQSITNNQGDSLLLAFKPS
uniref:F-box domain-containing protein n=1 Tax=Oryza meridionalis TaxID=40149 RepID=A0A0E0E9Q5_9ORYZ